MELDKVVTPTLAVVSVSLLTALWFWSLKRPTGNFPPGPRGWPIIGSMMEFTGQGPHLLFISLAEKYGDVFSIKIGAHWNVILNGTEAIKEALLKNAVEFAGRPMTTSIEYFTEGGKDIAFSQYSPTWKLHRKLTFSAFRNLATGDNARFERLVFTMTERVGKILESKGDEAFDPKRIVSLAVYNFVAQMVFGRQYELDDPDLLEYQNISETGVEVFGNGLMADFFPALRHFPTKGMKDMKDLAERFFKLINKELESHKQSYNPAAGTDTSIFTMHWAIACLVDHPDVQEKIQKEIDEVIGKERNPMMDDRGNLPYTESALYEVFRFSSIAPLAVPHATTKDITFRGYDIPKGTCVMPNLYSMHFDKKFWGDPENFRPEHFLDESGSMRQHPEGFLPFSTGRRVCLGESVAKAELFLIFTWLFQNFTFRKPAGKEEEAYSAVDKTALTPVLKPYEIIVSKRI